MFNTTDGNYKYLVIYVINYESMMWKHCFYNDKNEYEAFIDAVSRLTGLKPHAIYVFNNSKAVKEQWAHSTGSCFNYVLTRIIKEHLLPDNFL
jgi:hypothetical protein